MRGSLLALLISVMTIGGVIYHFSEQSLVRTVKQSLEYHAEFREARILALFEQQKRWMVESIEDAGFKRDVDLLMDSYQIGEASSAYQTNSRRFRDEYSLLLKAQGVDDLFLMNKSGELLYSLRPMEEELGVDLSAEGFYGETILSELIAQVQKERKLVISRYGKVEQVEEATVFMGIPMFSSFPGMEEELVAILVRPFTLSRLRSLLESYSGLGETGEVMIMQWRGEGMGGGINFINHFRDAIARQPDQACQKLRREEPNLFPALHALNHENGAGWMLDNSCIEVYAVWSWLPELEWGMVVKQDREEIMAPVASLQRNILIAAVLVLLFLFWMGLRQARALVQPIEQLTQAAERGEIDTHEPGRVEEVNHLAVTLQQSSDAMLRAIRETELILETMDEGLMVVDSDGRIIRVNPKLEELVGIEGGQLREQYAESLFTTEHDLICQDGSTIPVDLSRALLNAFAEEEDREVWVIHDLREVLKAENAMRVNKAKDQFFAMMSHELRTPLTAIIGYSEMLGERTWEHLSSKERNMLYSIEVAGRTQLALINDILDLSKIEAGKFEVDESDFDLSNLLDEIRYIFSVRAQDAGLDFQVRQHEPLRHQLVGDDKRIGQILMNLLSNAIKFTETGEVTLEVSVNREERMICFRIEDSGIGMSPEVLDRLFQPFEQADSSISRRYGGTGLGLHISYTLAELMDGTIDVESEVGRGTQFQLNLPLRLSEKRAQPQIEEDRSSQRQQFEGRVLLAEDLIELQKLEQYILESMGVTVTIAHNGQEAVELALKQPFDLVLMDMQMPVMGGIEATRLLKQSGYQGAVVALTANVMQPHQRDCEKSGCDGFLAKPIEQSALRAVLQQYLTPAATGNPQGAVSPEGVMSPEILAQLRPLFVERMIILREELNQALSSEDWEASYRAAHNIKGSAAPYGYPEITASAAQLCQDVDEQRLDRLPQLIKKLVQLIDNAVE